MFGDTQTAISLEVCIGFLLAIGFSVGMIIVNREQKRSVQKIKITVSTMD